MSAQGIDIASGVEMGHKSVLLEGFEVIQYRTEWLCEKFGEDQCEYARKKLGLPSNAEISSAALRSLGVTPDETEVRIGNLLLNEGIQELLDLLIGAGGSVTAYNNANAQIGVGDSSTAEAATQTDLQAATNKLFKAMNATFPSRASQTVTWQSDFTTSEANYVWNEWSIRNGATRDKNLNRKVQSLGTKTTGTWTLSGTLTLS